VCVCLWCVCVGVWVGVWVGVSVCVSVRARLRAPIFLIQAALLRAQ
jgi:hypothetical protein